MRKSSKTLAATLGTLAVGTAATMVAIKFTKATEVDGETIKKYRENQKKKEVDKEKKEKIKKEAEAASKRKEMIEKRGWIIRHGKKKELKNNK